MTLIEFLKARERRIRYLKFPYDNNDPKTKSIENKLKKADQIKGYFPYITNQITKEEMDSSSGYITAGISHIFIDSKQKYVLTTLEKTTQRWSELTTLERARGSDGRLLRGYFHKICYYNYDLGKNEDTGWKKGDSDLSLKDLIGQNEIKSLKSITERKK